VWKLFQLSRVSKSEYSVPIFRKLGWHSSIAAQSMPRTMYQLEGRAEGHLQGRSEHRIVVRWCRKFPKKNQLISPSMVANAHIAFSSRLDPYEGVGQSISCVRCGPYPESGAFDVAPISPRKLSRRLNAIPSLKLH
jgi:hypothetical protein